MLLCACGGNTTLGPDPTFALSVEPAAPAPCEPLVLRPVFSAGTGIVVGIGPVVSGESYALRPLTVPTTFELQVRLPLTKISRLLAVPLRYHERLTPVATTQPHTQQGAAVLDDGRVLIAGGSLADSGPSAEAEVYDPGTSTLVTTGELAVPRARGVVTPGPAGSAYVFGGDTGGASVESATEVEWWDPTTGEWSPMGHLSCKRIGHTVTLLPDGWFLVMGGSATCSAVREQRAEVWADGPGSTLPANQPLFQRTGHTATALDDGRVLVVGGRAPGTNTLVLAAELFDPTTRTFSRAGAVLEGRASHAAVRLPDGRVLVVGGEDARGRPLASAEVWDPAVGDFAPAGHLTLPRTRLAAALMGSGEVLVAGGITGARSATDSLEIWVPATLGFRPVAVALPAPRAGVSALLLDDARVLLVGGDAGDGVPSSTAIVLD